MLLSMWMLFDALSGSVCDHNLDEAAQAQQIKGALPFFPAREISSEYVYVSQAAGMENTCTNGAEFFVLFGDGSDIEPDCAYRYIRLQPCLNAAEAMHIVLKAFERYNDWYGKLQQELIGTPDLTRILNIGNELLDNYITLYGPEHELIAHAALPPDLLDNVLEKRGSSYVLSDKAYKSMVNRPDHQDDTRAEHAAFYTDPTRGLSILYANIGPGTFECRLCIGENRRPFTKSDPQLCEILAQILLTAFQKDYLSRADTKTYFRDLLHGILKGLPTEAPVLEHNLAALQWARRDRYVCLKIEKVNPAGRFMSSDWYICHRIENLLTDACALMLDGQIVCVARIQEGEKKEQALDRLGDFLKESIFIVGVSDEFDDLMDIVNYYKEASIAVQLGRATRPTNWYHLFSDYALLHFFQYGTSRLPALCYCDSNVRRLLTLDDSKVDFCETLRVYLEHDRNLLHAAASLHIHRTTLFYRLNRIRELLDVDLDDFAVRLRILFSFELIEMERNPERFMQ